MEDMQETVHVPPCRVPSNAEGTRMATADELPAGHHGWYGTRTSTVLLIARTTPARAWFVERDTYALAAERDSVPVHLATGEENERRYQWVVTTGRCDTHAESPRGRPEKCCG